MPAPSAEWLHEHPHIRTIRAAACDLNGVARGKRMPIPSAIKLLSDGTRFPYSALSVDIWGEDIDNSPLVFESGDRDATLFPTERGFVPMPWLDAPSALIPLWMYHEDGRPYDGDPRHALNYVLQRYEARGLTPVCAVELEFYLIDDSGRSLRVPVSPRSGKRRDMAEVLSIRALDAFDSFFTDLYDHCEAMDIPADTMISEAGLGQFEVNLLHQDDALKAADDAWLFKQLVKGLARKHGFAASFMAKPYEDYAGSGMHAHFSVLDRDGQNVFDNGGPEGTTLLHHAIAGCMKSLYDSTLIYAPHLNSYERFVPGAHAPGAICWAHENRTVAIRVPSGSPAARRIEHRLSGGDVNPYLALAAILGAALVGIEDGEMPPPAITGNAYAQDLPTIPRDWDTAIDAFEKSTVMPRIFPREMIRNLVMMKRQESRDMEDLTESERVDIYLDTV